MTITFRKNGNHYETLLNNEVIHRDKIYHSSQDPHILEDMTDDLVTNIFTCRAEDLPRPFNMAGYYRPKHIEKIDWLIIDVDSDSNEKSMATGLTEDLIHWKHPFTINEYIERLKSFDKSINADIDDGKTFITYSYDFIDDENIGETYDYISKKLVAICSSALESLNKEVFGSQLLRAFNFPPEYQTICSQYLMWFGEFLERNGINALISISNQNEETLVLLSSEHSEQMFSKIEALFSQYITLPYAEYLPASTQSLSPQQQFMVTQLQTQIGYFKGQLEMKSATIQLKEATIQSMQNIIDVQKNQLLLVESMKGDAEIELFGGAVKLGDIEWGPIKISPKKLLDKTKNK